MALTVDIRDQASAAIKAVKAELAPNRINPAIGAAGVRLFQNHFVSRGPNKRGWPSQGFWPGAARSTNYRLLADGVVISVNKQGVRQRYHGGVIRPTGGKKYLTIPARAEAYGRRAREFGRLDSPKGAEVGLRVAFNRKGPYALVEAAAQEISFGRKRKDGSRKVTRGREAQGLVMFWLVKEVRQDEDHSIIPSDREIGDIAMRQVRAAVDRIKRRAR